MEGRVEKKNDYLNGIHCSVNTCYYHGKGDHCFASHIDVEPKNADNSEITDCATFVHN